MAFISPTKGPLSFERMCDDIVEFVEGDPEAPYKLIVGSDSQTTHGQTCFVTAVVIHRQGKGARYYYQKTHQSKIKSLRQKIYYETSLSINLAAELNEWVEGSQQLADVGLEIHLDVGPHGATRDLIRETVGMVTGSGFDARIKPESYGATKVADRFTK